MHTVPKTTSGDIGSSRGLETHTGGFVFQVTDLDPGEFVVAEVFNTRDDLLDTSEADPPCPGRMILIPPVGLWLKPLPCQPCLDGPEAQGTPQRDAVTGAVSCLPYPITRPSEPFPQLCSSNSLTFSP